jgi:hypothetical protein
MFPIIVPILLAAVRATEAVVGAAAAVGTASGTAGGAASAGVVGSAGGTMPVVDLSLAGDWVSLLAGFDLVYLVVCTALFHFLVEE